MKAWSTSKSQAERWLAEEADQRVHGTVHEVVAERFAREAPQLRPRPAVRFDTAYREQRWVAWDGYVEVRGNRYSVPDGLCGQPLTVSISLAGEIRFYSLAGELVAEHRQRPVSQGWSTVAGHHERLWRQSVRVERRDLSVYEEVAQCT